MGEQVICVLEILIATILFVIGEIVKFRDYLWYKKAIKDSVHISDTKNKYLKKIHLKYNNMQKLNALYENSYRYAKRNIEKLSFLTKSSKIFKVTLVALIYEFVVINLVNNYKLVTYANNVTTFITDIVLCTYIFVMIQTAIILNTAYQKNLCVYSIEEALSVSKSGSVTKELQPLVPNKIKLDDNQSNIHIQLSKEEAKIVEDIMTEYFWNFKNYKIYKKNEKVVCLWK